MTHATLPRNAPRRNFDELTRLVPWAVLLVVFDGDPAAWVSYLAEEGTMSQRRNDLPLARVVAARCASDESFRLRLRSLARDLHGRSR